LSLFKHDEVEGDGQMAKMVYDEWYGELTVAQRAAYRKFNVSPSDHHDLADQHEAITRFVKDHVKTGMYRRPRGMFNLVKSKVTGEIRSSDELWDGAYGEDYDSWAPLARARA
jgi:hypothetical protein